jgi:hypothetical protein
VSDLDFVQAGDLYRKVMNDEIGLTEKIPCVHSMYERQSHWIITRSFHRGLRYMGVLPEAVQTAHTMQKPVFRGWEVGAVYRGIPQGRNLPEPASIGNT